MPRKWLRVSLPLVGAGEQSAAAPGAFAPGEASVLSNAIIKGPGLVSQQPDWLLAATLEDGAADEDHAAVGVFPFEQQGGAASASQGVAFSMDATAQVIRLHQLGEDLTVLRRFTAYSSYTEANRPQITGFEMFGKFYFNEYARQTTALRKGMGVFDPTGGGTVTVPTFDLNTGANPAAALRFRGIVRHRGATILGWGYNHEDDEDAPQMIRHSKWGTPDTWVADTSETSAGFFNVGTLEVPIVGCATSGQFTVIGKQSEIFVLDGDYSSQFYLRQIGNAHGPVSTTGIVSIGEAGVWMADAGPAISIQGGAVQLLGVDKVTRRFLQYMDLLNASGAHDKANTRVLWALRRRFDEDGNAVSLNHLSELLVWDYRRNQFYVSTVPAQIWALGTSRGPGVSLAGPSGVVSGITASDVTDSTAIISWTPGDVAPDVSFQLQWRPNTETEWRPNPALNTPDAVTSQQITGLPSDADGEAIDVRVRQVRNGQTSAWTTSVALFTTLAINITQTPTSVAVALTGFSVPPSTSRVRCTFTPYVSRSTELVMRLYRNTANNFATARRVAQTRPQTGEVEDPTDHAAGLSLYYWLRMENIVDATVSAAVQATPAPIETGELPEGDPS